MEDSFVSEIIKDNDTITEDNVNIKDDEINSSQVGENSDLEINAFNSSGKGFTVFINPNTEEQKEELTVTPIESNESKINSTFVQSPILPLTISFSPEFDPIIKSDEIETTTVAPDVKENTENNDRAEEKRKESNSRNRKTKSRKSNIDSVNENSLFEYKTESGAFKLQLNSILVIFFYVISLKLLSQLII